VERVNQSAGASNLQEAQGGVEQLAQKAMAVVNSLPAASDES
jgi:hypothetical protein